MKKSELNGASSSLLKKEIYAYINHKKTRRSTTRTNAQCFTLLKIRCPPKKNIVDFYLHSYSSYEEYRNTQILHNERKLGQIWADETTLARVANIVLSHAPAQKEILGLCHGTRNGFEQRYFNNQQKLNAIGTDISPTANQFHNSVQFDFHDVNVEWVNRFDFVYSNSLDQSWQPKTALTTWFNQVRQDGLVILEHTKSHGPGAAGKMDPFGVRPIAMPYVLTEWFGHQISVAHTIGKKANNGLDCWLFVCRKLTKTIV